MIKNYMTYPLKHMRITQSYSGDTSHRKHWENADYKDYPIDDGGENEGVEAIYCPCDEMIVTGLKGVGNSATNTVWLVSTSKVVTPTFKDIAFMTLTHSNDQDLSSVSIGRKYKRGEVICHEGRDGASANHIHITCGRGSSDNWRKNSNGSWVIAGDTKKPEEVFYIDRSFTTEIWGGYLPWQTLPNDQVGTPVERNSKKDQLEVQVDNLNARKTPSLEGEKIGYIKRGIYDYQEIVEKDGYRWYKVEDFYIAYREGWEIIYPKEEEPIEVLEDEPSTKPTEPIKEKEQTTSSEEKNTESQESMKPKLIFRCPKSGKYLISLKEGEELYLL